MKTGVFFAIFSIVLISALWADETNNRPDVFVYASDETLLSLDPASCSDGVCNRAVLNIYEPLVFFDGSSTSSFAPVLALDTPTLINGGISQDGKTYIFKIRKGIRFHEGGRLTAGDVRYSMKRGMIADPVNGAQSLLLKALTGETATRDSNGNIIPGIFERIDNSIEVIGDAVVFHLPEPFQPFLTLLARASSVILQKEWASANGCWDGNIESASIYNRIDPDDASLKRIANGTGAFRLKTWEPSERLELNRFGGYHGDAPNLKTAIIKYVQAWDKRKRMLQYGGADRVKVELPYISEVERMKGVVVYKTPRLAATCALFCRNVRIADNPLIGSGKMDGNGVPPDFFWDENARKAFLHAFDRNAFTNRVFKGMVISPSTPHIKGLAFHQETPVYHFNLKKAEEFMKKAWDGRAWKNGFKMTIAYNAGNIMRETAAYMIAGNVMSLNPRFEIRVLPVSWNEFTDGYRNRLYSMFLAGWQADFPDPYNFMHAFMHSKGAYGAYSGYQNEEIDRLCEQSLTVVDIDERKRILAKLRNFWFEEAMGILVYQEIGARVYRENVRGFIPNAAFGGEWENLKYIRKD